MSESSKFWLYRIVCTVEILAVDLTENFLAGSELYSSDNFLPPTDLAGVPRLSEKGLEVRVVVGFARLVEAPDRYELCPGLCCIASLTT